MPNSMLGNRVAWYPSGERSGNVCAAIVTGPAEDHKEKLLSLAIFRETSTVVYVEKGVRHVDDPKLEQFPRMKERGAWDFFGEPAAPPTKREQPKKSPDKPAAST